MEDFVLASGNVLKVHEIGTCAGEICVIHNPSNHPYRDLPMSVDSHARMVRKTSDGLGYIIDPDSARFFGMTILRNSARCLTCGTAVHSIHRHDFVECKCGNVFVDGGYDYVRHGFADHKAYEDTSIHWRNYAAS